MSQSAILAMSEAEAALGRLSGLGYLIREPQTLIGPYLTREALASSRIEGTQASLSDVLQAEIGDADEATADVVEVTRYLSASRQAFSLVETLPITQRLILDVHRTLLSGVRGEEKSPGNFRCSPVWVGSAGATPDNATYVPPPPDQLPALLTDWENYVNTERSVPVLLHGALMHYQFETIHPFLDGNGRIGRLLISLLLKERRRLELPLLYLSNFFETNREAYYEALQGVRERGEIEPWLLLFFEGVRAQSDDAIWRARRLVDLRETYLLRASETRSKLPQLVQAMVANPFVTVQSAQRATGLSAPGARNLVRRAEELGWLRSLGTHGRGGREHWYASDLLEIMEGPLGGDTAAN
ncbi:Fic family protein [Nostocoides japonicum]|nr:Fic family protein [Tetrasphaera japonica]